MKFASDSEEEGEKPLVPAKIVNLTVNDEKENQVVEPRNRQKQENQPIESLEKKENSKKKAKKVEKKVKIVEKKAESPLPETRPTRAARAKLPTPQTSSTKSKNFSRLSTSSESVKPSTSAARSSRSIDSTKSSLNNSALSKSTKLSIDSLSTPETKMTRKSAKISQSLLKMSVSEKKTYKIAVTNISDSDTKKKLEKICVELGSTIVDHIKDADVLLTNNKMKMTAKFLASICKGIPIVGREFVDASWKAEKWLDPFDFILVDRELEARKSISMKAVIAKAKSHKFLKDHSVFITKNTAIPSGDLREILENAEAECIEDLRQTPKFKKVLLIYNSKETAQISAVTRLHPKVKKIRDIQVCQVVLQQKF
jgi:hypothetical protein